MATIEAKAWNLRGYPEPYVPPEVQRLIEAPPAKEEEALASLATKFEGELPRSPRHNLILPEDPMAVVLAAARMGKMLVAEPGADEKVSPDLDGARYGMAPALIALGMWAWKRKLEDMALRVGMPERFARLEQGLEDFQRRQASLTTETEAAIVDRLAAAKLEHSTVTIWCSVDGASRRLQSLRLNDYSFATPSNFYDVYVLVEDVDDCYRALQAVHEAGPPTPAGFQDLIASPHSNGFSALTTRIRRQGVDRRGDPKEETVNVVIQTRLMHEVGWQGVAHAACAEGSADHPPFIAALLATARPDRRKAGPRERQVGLRPTITVYSLGGHDLQPNPHELEAGATVLDFAYMLHGAIGNEATSAVVEGKLVESLGHVLEEGAVVRIRRDPTGRNMRTVEDLDHVATPQARFQLTRSLKRQGSTMRGRMLVLRVLEERSISVRGRTRLDELVEDAVASLGGELEDRTIEGIYRHIVEVSEVQRRRREKPREERSKEEPEEEPITAGSVAAAVAAALARPGSDPADTRLEQWRPVPDGDLEITARFADLCRSCRPAPTDREIVGIKRAGHITIHATRCRHGKNPRAVPMHWTRVEGRVRGLLNVVGVDRSGLVIDACETVRRHGCGLEQVSAEADYLGKARLALHIYADSSSTVSELAKELREVSGVTIVSEDTVELPVPDGSLAGEGNRRPALSRVDASPLQLRVRPDDLPVRHDLIEIPYDIQRPCASGRFFGREKESQDLITATWEGDGRAIFVCGPRMIGKSSLALRFSDGLPEAKRPLIMRADLRSCKSATSQQTLEKVLAEFRGHEFADRGIPDAESPEQTIEALAAACDRPVVMVLDEFGGPLESFSRGILGERFFDWLRTIMDRSQPRRQLSLMMAGPPEAGHLLRSDAYREIGERLLPEFTLGALSAAAAREMFTEPLLQQGIAVRDAAAEMVVDHCGRHPHYLIRLLEKVATRLDEDRRRWHVGKGDIRNGINDLLSDHLPLSNWVAESAPKLVGKMCLDTLAAVSSSPSQYIDVDKVARHAQLDPAAVKSTIEMLRLRQLVDRDREEPNAYRCDFPLLHEWVRRGGIRRDYFASLDRYKRRCLVEVAAQQPNSWLSLGRLADAVGVGREHAGEAVDGLVESGAMVQNGRGQVRLAVPALRDWADDYHRGRLLLPAR